MLRVEMMLSVVDDGGKVNGRWSLGHKPGQLTVGKRLKSLWYQVIEVLKGPRGNKE